ncbi:hypothetical protein G7046_g4352 [Stylonectria norvegica]|nr:hypothetical protein G7046_g4352 [Stylonectria norvegica]
MSLQQNYNHSKLGSERSIRVLVLEPAESDLTQIVCGLEEVTLDSKLNIEAISYSWDDQTPSKHILCRDLHRQDGVDAHPHTLQVTANCYSILQHLRQQTTPRRLWIDGICINQADLDERNAQVAIVAEIYQCAKHVIVWLGEKDEETERAMKFIVDAMELLENASTKYDHLSSVGHAQDTMLEQFSKRNIEDEQAKMAQKFSSLVQLSRGISPDPIRPLLQRSWFHRMWTVQEVMLPWALDVKFHCGDVIMSFWPVIGVAVIMMSAQAGLVRGNTAKAMELQLVVAGQKQTRDREKHEAEPCEKATAERSREWLRQRPIVPSAPIRLTSILGAARFKFCKEPKDKIFALHGVFKYLGIPLPAPDYHKSIERIFTEAASTAIEGDKCLDILLQVPNSKRLSTLPSWVPDFTHPGFEDTDPRNPSANGRLNHLNACGSRLPQISVGPNLKLKVEAKILDVVASRLPSFQLDIYNNVSNKDDPKTLDTEVEEERKISKEIEAATMIMQQWLTSAVHGASSTYPTQEPNEEALHRTLIDDHPEGRYDAVFTAKYKLWLSALTAPATEIARGLLAKGKEMELASLRADLLATSPAQSLALVQYPKPFNKLINDITVDEIKSLQNMYSSSNLLMAALSEEPLVSFSPTIAYMNRNLAFYTTAAKRFGTAPDRLTDSIIAGDKIAVIAGLKSPVVLRPRENGAYAFISHCYCHGFMHGEALDEGGSFEMIELRVATRALSPSASCLLHASFQIRVDIQYNLKQQCPTTLNCVGYVYHHIEDVELLEKYRIGGFHPVSLGDDLKDGRYRIVHKLGHGGHSTVWLAWDSLHLKYVAAKICSSDSSLDSKELSVLQLLAEPSAHPGRSLICPVLDHFKLRGPNGTHICLVTAPAMMSLKDAKEASASALFQLSTARTVAAQMIWTVAYLHEKGIVHGDLHLGNFLFKLPDRIERLTAEGLYKEFDEPELVPLTRLDGASLGDGVPSHAVVPIWLGDKSEDLVVSDASILLSDFGESYHPLIESRTHSNIPLGSRPPEAFFPSPDEPFGFGTDIWSLGCLIWEVLGQRPIYDSWVASDDEVLDDQVDLLGKLPQRWWQRWENRAEFWAEQGDDIELAPTRHSDHRRWDWESRVELCIQKGRREEKDMEGQLSEEETEDFLDMMKRMIVFEPEQRASATEILRSRWVQKWALPALRQI